MSKSKRPKCTMGLNLRIEDMVSPKAFPATLGSTKTFTSAKSVKQLPPAKSARQLASAK